MSCLRFRTGPEVLPSMFGEPEALPGWRVWLDTSEGGVGTTIAVPADALASWSPSGDPCATLGTLTVRQGTAYRLGSRARECLTKGGK